MCESIFGARSARLLTWAVGDLADQTAVDRNKGQQQNIKAFATDYITLTLQAYQWCNSLFAFTASLFFFTCDFHLLQRQQAHINSQPLRSVHVVPRRSASAAVSADYVSSCVIPLMPVVYQVVGFGRGNGRHSDRQRRSVV